MRVLSLFDGISCGMVALERAGIPVERYVAYEINEPSIKISKKNYPTIEHKGDVTNADFSEYIGFDLLIGGSPCQDLSGLNTVYRQKGKTGLKGEKSRLFYAYVDALNTVAPKYFLFENVASMKAEWRDEITRELGVEPVMINSALVSAQERKRLYWTNIPNVTQPSDKGIVLDDIILSAEKVPEKYWYRGKKYTLNGEDDRVIATLDGEKIFSENKRVFNPKHKCGTLCGDGAGGNLQKKVYQNGAVRKLTPLEYERLQTLPDNYTEGAADSHRYTAVGNGWTVDEIAHILGGLHNA